MSENKLDERENDLSRHYAATKSCAEDANENECEFSDDAEVKHFTTVNAADWFKSPYVPYFGGEIANERDKDGNCVDCWRIDSRGGKWTTLCGTVPCVKAGEKVRLLLWAKFTGGGAHELMLSVTQSEWEKRADFRMNESKPHLLCKNGDFCLFTAIYTAVEDETVFFNLSANNVLVSYFPAVSNDLNLATDSDVGTECEPNYKIIECYREKFPECRFVGKCYKNSDRVDGLFTAYWVQWHNNGWFEVLERLVTDEFKIIYPEFGSYIGLMRNKYGAPDDYFEYWIGMFLPAGCDVPDGFGFVDINHSEAGICLIKGYEDSVYCHEGECYDKLVDNGMTIPSESDGGCLMFERYICPRSTCPDENGKVILDLGFFVEKISPEDIAELKYREGREDCVQYFSLPDARVIGKSIRVLLNKGEGENPIPAFWDECGNSDFFVVCDSLPKLIPAKLGFTDDYDGQTNTFLYIAGVLCPKDTAVPEGYAFRDIPATIVSKSRYGEWLGECHPIWSRDGFEWSGAEGQFWNAELYLDGEDGGGFRLLCAVMEKNAKKSDAE